MTTRLAQARGELLARERRTNARDLHGRRRFNAVLRGGAVEPLRHITMKRIDSARLSFEVSVHDEIQYLIRHQVIRGDQIFLADAVMMDGSKQRMIVKRIHDIGEVEAMRSAHVALALHGCRRCAQFPRVVATATHVSKDADDTKKAALGSYVLMPYAKECVGAGEGSVAAMELPCQVTLSQLLRGRAFDVTESAYVEILLRVVRALRVLNRKNDVFVHGDLHPGNILVRLATLDVDAGGVAAEVEARHIDRVMLIDTGMSFVDTRDVVVRTARWAKRCGGAASPHPSRDLMTLMLSLTHLTPLKFSSVHDTLIRPLVEHMASNFDSFQKLNQCDRLLKFLGDPSDEARLGETTYRTPDGRRQEYYWEEGDFQYDIDVTGEYARIADRQGDTMTELHHAMYADTVPKPKNGPFSTLSAMESALSRM